MNVPPEVIFHDVERTPWLEGYIGERLEKLDRLAEGIIRTHVTVTRAQGSQHKGNVYSVMVEVRLPPNQDLAAKKEREVADPREELRPLVKSAFEAIERQVKETAEKRRYDVKSPVEEGERHGMVAKLFPEGYGFIRTVDNDREFYFHRNAVLHEDFERLAIGTEVRFMPGEGEMGPQASSVQVVSKPGARATPP